MMYHCYSLSSGEAYKELRSYKCFARVDGAEIRRALRRYGRREAVIIRSDMPKAKLRNMPSYNCSGPYSEKQIRAESEKYGDSVRMIRTYSFKLIREGRLVWDIGPRCSLCSQRVGEFITPYVSRTRDYYCASCSAGAIKFLRAEVVALMEMQKLLKKGDDNERS